MDLIVRNLTTRPIVAGPYRFEAGTERTITIRTGSSVVAEIRANRFLRVRVVAEQAEIVPEALLCSCGFVAKSAGGLTTHQRARGHA